jgi:hypothetical protein
MPPDPASTEIIGLAALVLATLLATVAFALGRARDAIEAASFVSGVVGAWIGGAVYLVGLFTDLY